MASRLQDIALLRKEIEKHFKDSIEIFPSFTTIKKIPVVKSGSVIIDTVTGVGGFPRGRITEIFGGESSGKGLPLDEPVLAVKTTSPQGGFQFYEMGELEVGDRVKCPDGTNSCIKAIFDNERPVYEVTFRDGSKLRCDDQHLWPARIDGQCKWDYEVMGMLEVKSWFDKGYQVAVPLLEVPPDLGCRGRHGGEERSIDPYMMGLVLGDGGVHSGAEFHSTDLELGKYAEGQGFVETTYPSAYKRAEETGHLLLREWNLRKKDNTKEWDRWRLTGLRDLTAGQKFIPKSFLFASAETRLAVLQGLMDTDGGVSQNGSSAEFSSKSRVLAEGVVFLVRSLGGQARLAATVVEGQTYYRVGVRVDGVPLFRLERKKRLLKPNLRGRQSKTIIGIQAIGVMSTRCIKIDHPKGLFIVRDFTVTHNTTIGIKAVASIQAEDPNGCALFVDFEQAIDVRYARSLGMDLDEGKLILAQPEYFEMGAQIIDAFVEKDMVDLIVIDSAAAMIPRDEMEGAADATVRIGLQSQLMSRFLGRITKKIARGRRPALVILNQTRTKIDVNNPRNTGEDAAGGKALKFYTSIRLSLEVIRKEGDTLRSKTPVGVDKIYTQSRVRIVAVKNKLAVPFIRAQVVLQFGKGIDNVTSIAELAESELGIMAGAGYFKYVGDTPGTTFSCRGREAFLDILNKSPATLHELEYKISQQMKMDQAKELGIATIILGEDAKVIEEVPLMLEVPIEPVLLKRYEGVTDWVKETGVGLPTEELE